MCKELNTGTFDRSLPIGRHNVPLALAGLPLREPLREFGFVLETLFALGLAFQEALLCKRLVRAKRYDSSADVLPFGGQKLVELHRLNAKSGAKVRFGNSVNAHRSFVMQRM